MMLRCLYDPKAPIRYVCREENQVTCGKDVPLHQHCSWVECSCAHHKNEEGHDHTDCRCPRKKTATTDVTGTSGPAYRQLRRPTPKDAVAAAGEPADSSGVGPVVDGVRRRLVRPGQR